MLWTFAAVLNRQPIWVSWTAPIHRWPARLLHVIETRGLVLVPSRGVLK